MGGDNDTLTTLLLVGAAVGTGGAALGAAFPTLGGIGAVGGMGPASLGFFGANAGTFSTLGALASAGLQVAGGFQAGAASDLERQQLEEQAQLELTQAAIDKADREKRLADILSTQDAMFSSRGIMLGSGVSDTARNLSLSAGNKESSLAELNSLVTQRQYMTAADQKTLEGSSARTLGFARAGTSLLSSYEQGAFGG